jgi:hypothetical protein
MVSKHPNTVFFGQPFGLSSEYNQISHTCVKVAIPGEQGEYGSNGGMELDQDSTMGEIVAVYLTSPGARK